MTKSPAAAPEPQPQSQPPATYATVLELMFNITAGKLLSFDDVRDQQSLTDFLRGHDSMVYQAKTFSLWDELSHYDDLLYHLADVLGMTDPAIADSMTDQVLQTITTIYDPNIDKE